MTKKSPIRGSRRGHDENEAHVQMEDTQFRYVDQAERWKHEYEHCKAVEGKLAAVSELSYEPIDFESQLIRTPWQEREIPNYDYLVDDAKMAVEKKYFLPIAQRIGLIALSLIILIIGGIGLSATIVLIAGTGGAAVGVSLYFVKKFKEEEMLKTTAEAQAESERRYTQEKMMADEARQQHENSENERIAAVEKLLEGDLPSIVLRLDVVLPQIVLPFPVEVNIDLFNNVPLVKVWLPSKLVIPKRTCELLPSGRLKYEDKDIRNINKQYLELCSSALMRIMAVIYANIPVFDQGYICGMSKEGGAYSDCLINVSLNRDILMQACKAANGLAAIQTAKAQLEYDTNLNLKAIEEKTPEEWGEIDQSAVRSIHLKIFK